MDFKENNIWMIIMTHTDTDIAEILERFDAYIYDGVMARRDKQGFLRPIKASIIKDFITRECLALKKKWEREHFDNQDERG